MQIKLEHLTKRFGDTVAVNDLSITLESGKLIALLGPSGCGKTTTLNMISGILPVSGGSIFFDDRDVTSLPPEKRGIGLVFQNYALYPHMTVLQNICFPMEDPAHSQKGAHPPRRGAGGDGAHHSVSQAQARGALRRPAAARRALRARWSKRPDVLLLDEPLSNLDAKLRVEMRDGDPPTSSSEAGITTVFVTHDQEEASSIADRVVLLRDGVLQQEDTARGLYENPVNLFAADFLGTPPINQLHGVVQNGRLVLDGGIPAALVLPDGLAEGQEIVLAVRAESILPQGDTPAFRTTVLERYSLGKDELVRLQAGPAELRGLVPAELEILPGTELAVGLKKRGVFLFDAKTGVR